MLVFTSEALIKTISKGFKAEEDINMCVRLDV